MTSSSEKRPQPDHKTGLLPAKEDEEMMTLDTDKIDDAALAILSLTLHDGDRVWKGIDWAIMDRLFEKGLIDDPRRKAKSLTLTNEGVMRARAILAREFSKAE